MRYLMPHNIRSDSAPGSRYDTAEIVRARLIRCWGEEKFISDGVVPHLLYCFETGFAIPNGSLAWTLLFTEWTQEQIDRVDNLIDSCGILDFSMQNITPMRRPMIRLTSVDCMRSPLFGSWRGNSYVSKIIGAEDLEFLQTLPIVDVGRSDSRDYTTLAQVASLLIEAQTGIKEHPRDGYPDLADPWTLSNNFHTYVDRLVRINNEVQKFCDYARNTADAYDVQLAHELKWTDEQMERIARSAPGVLFTQSLKSPATSCPETLSGVVTV